MSIGCCGNVIRSTLILINGLFLVIGTAIVTASAYARWNTTSLLNQLEQKESFTITEPLNVTTIVLLMLGTFIIMLSACGLFGAIMVNKGLLIFYQVTFVFAFVCHGAGILKLFLPLPFLLVFICI